MSSVRDFCLCRFALVAHPVERRHDIGKPLSTSVGETEESLFGHGYDVFRVIDIDRLALRKPIDDILMWLVAPLLS